MISTVLAVAIVGIVVALPIWARVNWERRPSLLSCALMWLLVYLFQIPTVLAHPDLSHALVFVGLTFNASVTLANRGRMPGSKVTRPGLGRIWVRRRPYHRLAWLGDNWLFGTSIGDWLLFGGLALSALEGWK